MRNLNQHSLRRRSPRRPNPSLLPSTADAPACTFSIGSEPNAPSVPVVVYGRLASAARRSSTKGSTFRIVGRIAQDVDATAATGTFHLCVVAEHIEPKPASTSKLIPRSLLMSSDLTDSLFGPVILQLHAAAGH